MPEGDKSIRPALEMRAAKRAHANTLGINEAFIDLMVERFYSQIRHDDLLGPIFCEHIQDWPEHLDRMKTFWRSIMHNSGEYSGNPMARHMAIARLEHRHFVRWLNIFYANLNELELSDEGVRLVGMRARSIADSLLTEITTRRHGISGIKAGLDLPDV